MLKPMNTPLPGMRGLRIWVVGASSGIGAALARQALAAGARVAVSARSAAPLAELAANGRHGAQGGQDAPDGLAGQGGQDGRDRQALAVPFDVRDAAAWHGAHHAIVEAFGAIDLVVFCAAIYRPERSWEVDPAQAAATLDTNLASVYAGLAVVLPPMLARGQGGVALVASVAGYAGLPNASVYGPSKAALINLAEILYGDLRPRGLDVYLVNPGFVKTRLTDQNRFTMPALVTPEQAAASIWRGVAAGRFEIHFPHRFTRVMKLLRLMPYRWRFYLFHRFLHTS